MKHKVITTYGAWGAKPITGYLTSELEKLTNREVTPISLSGHDGERFTPEMGGWSLEDYMLDIMERLPLGKVVMVSHSMTAICSYYLAQRYPNKFSRVIMIDPPMMGGGANVEVSMIFAKHPLRYLIPLFANKAIVPTEADAKTMLFNDEDSPFIEGIARQPASGRAIRQMLFKPLSKVKTIVPCTVVIAEGSRLHPARQKRAWAAATGSDCVTINDSHCGIMTNVNLPSIVHNAL